MRHASRVNARITPTPVGNTKEVPRNVCEEEDHPHTCGEYLAGTSWYDSVMGSPPHLWGILVAVLAEALPDGITPTPVGNTLNNPYHTGILIFGMSPF